MHRYIKGRKKKKTKKSRTEIFCSFLGYMQPRFPICVFPFISIHESDCVLVKSPGHHSDEYLLRVYNVENIRQKDLRSFKADIIIDYRHS